MSQARRCTILVGVDGSPESQLAARWAAAEAERRHLSLLMTLAISEPVPDHSAYVFPPAVLQAHRKLGRERLDGAARAIRDEFPDLSIRTSLASPDPRRALVTTSKDVQLTVVGTRGAGGLPDVAVGSVALHVAAHAHSPVAVIPPAADAVGTGPAGPILVGVDGHPDSSAAIGYAYDEAAVRQTELWAVLVMDNLLHQGFAKRGNVFGGEDDGEAHALLAEQLAGWCEKYPDVPVQKIVLRGRPAQTLLGYAMNRPEIHRPRLFVVGSRGRGGLAGLLLGSTSQRMVTHARAPVIVVRPDNES